MFELATFDSFPNTAFTCNKLVVATGLGVPYQPAKANLSLVTLYRDSPFDGQEYAGQNVLILGKGNSAFEVAKVAGEYANFVHIMSRDVVRAAFQTHYIGDVRAVNLPLLVFGFTGSDVVR